MGTHGVGTPACLSASCCSWLALLLRVLGATGLCHRGSVLISPFIGPPSLACDAGVQGQSYAEASSCRQW